MLFQINAELFSLSHCSVYDKSNECIKQAIFHTTFFRCIVIFEPADNRPIINLDLKQT